jgi:predicted dehydrogenase
MAGMGNLRVGIVGTGLIGGKRADALVQLGDRVVAVTDIDEAKAQAFAEKYQAERMEQWESLVRREDLDTIIVATSNDVIPVCAMSALESGKHVFVEKPAGRFPDEVRRLVRVAKFSTGILGVGFNHRFHPAFQKAYELFISGAIGNSLYLRARYGHGGRIGYDKEWRADPKISGGGNLLDQGVHLIDLARWFFGELNLESGMVDTFYWDMPVEDNSLLVLKAPSGKKRAILQASCIEWKNLFDFEIYGESGKLQILGLGGSYGIETLRHFKVLSERGAPTVEAWEYPGPDLSWQSEWEAFRERIKGQRSHLATGEDALRTLEIVHEAYRSNEKDYAKP